MWKLAKGKGALHCDDCDGLIKTPFHPDELDWNVTKDRCWSCKEDTKRGTHKEVVGATGDVVPLSGRVPAGAQVVARERP